METIDVLVVGCGITGSVVARFFAEELDKKVLIMERRDHIGGNMYDYFDAYGTLVHKYGPHTFHTNNQYLFEYIASYGRWIDFKLTCKAEIDGIVTPTPFNFQTIDNFYSETSAKELKHRIRKIFGSRDTATVTEVLASPDPVVSSYAKFLFEKDYAPYTAKQWGVPPDEIDPSVLARVPLRFSYADGYFDDAYQIMPAVSYADFFTRLLDHPNIFITLGVEALNQLEVSADGLGLTINGTDVDFPVIYTGALDELFGCSLGKLPYRSLRFEWMHEDIESFQEAPVVAYPQAEGYTRITEYKKLPPQDVSGTTYAIEYPMPYRKGEVNEPYYPVLTPESKTLYAQYRDMAERIKYLYLCGRLADFQYYNMDQALQRALDICNSFK